MNNKYIIKATGEREEFNPQKLHDSLMRAGASEEATDNIVSQIEKELKIFISTLLTFWAERKSRPPPDIHSVGQ